ncbi:hypothetical protein N7493_005636 [Penicillium malachiteum]|uniref:Uncharacterized protein n=1 Tax=Penicillium malachiteum TaxID=1324776 RepID=A0AAD6HNV8_9EURO|nr:hypothetical protein N7493_005636 [Penicillium malachiteum]
MPKTHLKGLNWLVNDRELAPLIKQEFAMYEWHALPTTQPRLGWSRMMTHSLIQQVIRQDPATYALYFIFPGSQPPHSVISLVVSETPSAKFSPTKRKREYEEDEGSGIQLGNLKSEFNTVQGWSQSNISTYQTN